MKVDIHVHIMLQNGDTANFKPGVEKLLDSMDRAGIDKSNVIPLIYSVHPDEETENFLASFITEYITVNPRFYSMIWLNPHLPINFLSDMIKRLIINGPVNGVKLLNDMNAADRSMEPLAGFMEKHDVPVLIHSWYNTLKETEFEATPKDVACLAGKFPGLRIVMAHLRGAGYRGVQDIKKHKNIIIDTCGSESEDGYMRYALDELGPERVIFGTDYPGRDFPAAIGRVESAEMTGEQRDMVFYQNAVKFLEGRKTNA